jgi:hypothetical protein
MKVLILLLVCSLAANAAYLLTKRAVPADADALAEAASSAAANPSAETERQAVDALFDPDRTDPKSLAAQLEAAGYPPEIARVFAAAQVQHDIRQRQQALVNSVEPAPFWQTTASPFSSPVSDPEKERQVNALRRELAERLKELTGNNPVPEDLSPYSHEQRWGPIPAEKIAAAQKIDSDYAELRRELLAGRNAAILTTDDQEKIALLNREHRADIEAVLTPEEIFERNLRQSPTASRLRSQLAPFSPSEEEYRAIFRIQYDLDAAGGRDAAYAGVIYITSGDREAERSQLIERVKPVLGEERFADFEFATDSSNTRLVRLTNRLGLPLDAAREVVAARDNVNQVIGRLRSDASLPAAERDAIIADLSRATTQKLVGTLGERGYEAYLENGGGWATQIVPPTQRSSPPSR